MVGSWAFDDNILWHISFITLRLTNILMLAPQEHFRAGVVALMLNAAPSVHEEHLEEGHLHSIRYHLHSIRYHFHTIKYHFHCIGYLQRIIYHLRRIKYHLRKSIRYHLHNIRCSIKYHLHNIKYNLHSVQYHFTVSDIICTAQTFAQAQFGEADYHQHSRGDHLSSRGDKGSPELEFVLFHLLEERPVVIAGRATAVKPDVKSYTSHMCFSNGCF